MRIRDKNAAKRRLVQMVLATALGSRRAIVVTAIAASLLVSGVAYAALCGGGPAEAWTIGMITALTNAVVGQIGSFTVAFMAESQIRFEQVISALAVATKQEGISANQVVDASRNAGETLLNAVRAQRINDAAVKAYVDYSPQTGQGYDACGTLARNRSLDKAFGDAPARARNRVATLDAAPGALVESRVKSMADRLNMHRSKFCTQSEADAGLCSVGSVPGGDANAALLFAGASNTSDEALARKAFIQNVIGAPDQKITQDAGKSQAGQAYLAAKNKKDALMSIPAYSLAMIDANNTRTDEYNGTSPNEMMKARVNAYFGGKEAQQWAVGLAKEAPRGLILEANKMAGLEVWLRQQQYEQGQRLEANLAALVLTGTDEMQADVDRKHAAVLQQTATSKLKE